MNRNKNTNWFDCGNWQSFKIPNQTVNISIGVDSVQDAIIDFTAPFASNYGSMANCDNSTILNFKLQAEPNPNNVINVFGNLTINSIGILDMDDNNNTVDRVLKLSEN